MEQADLNKIIVLSTNEPVSPISTVPRAHIVGKKTASIWTRAEKRARAWIRAWAHEQLVMATQRSTIKKSEGFLWKWRSAIKNAANMKQTFEKRRRSKHKNEEYEEEFETLKASDAMLQSARVYQTTYHDVSPNSNDDEDDKDEYIVLNVVAEIHHIVPSMQNDQLDPYTVVCKDIFAEIESKQALQEKLSKEAQEDGSTKQDISMINDVPAILAEKSNSIPAPYAFLLLNQNSNREDEDSMTISNLFETVAQVHTIMPTMKNYKPYSNADVDDYGIRIIAKEDLKEEMPKMVSKKAQKGGVFVEEDFKMFNEMDFAYDFYEDLEYIDACYYEILQ